VELSDKINDKEKQYMEKPIAEYLMYSHSITLILKYAETKLYFAIELNSFLGKENIKKTLQDCQKAK